jgi:hypothetical protein
MRVFITVLLIGLMPFTINAEEKPAVCKIITAHKPADDVAYKAGVDVYGNSVVPADINAAPFQAPNVIKVPLDVDLAQRVNRLNDLGLQMEAPLGMLEVHQDGSVKYNGQDWTAPVLTLCGESHKQLEGADEPAEPLAESKEQDRQSAPDAIKSPEVENPNAVIDKIEAGMVSKAIEVSPTVAVPPRVIKKEPEIIQGGEYKDYNYNE